MKIGDVVKNTITGAIEQVKTIKGNYINGYRSDLFELLEATQTEDINNLPESILTHICLKMYPWNKKIYGSDKRYIYIDNHKYYVTLEQIQELNRHFEMDF